MYFALLGELYGSVDTVKAQVHYRKALNLAKASADKQIIQEKLDCFSTV